VLTVVVSQPPTGRLRSKDLFCFVGAVAVPEVLAHLVEEGIEYRGIGNSRLNDLVDHGTVVNGEGTPAPTLQAAASFIDELSAGNHIGIEGFGAFDTKVERDAIKGRNIVRRLFVLGN